MSVREAVEKVGTNGGVPAQVSTADVVKRMISMQAKALEAVLPEHLDGDRYARLIITAIKANPKLMAAFATQQGQVSVLLSAMQAAALGLEPNTPTQECWLQPRRRKIDNQWTDECELSIGYKGYAKLARRSGDVKELFAGVVREGDEFEFARGLDRDTFHHKPTAPDEAPFTHVYAIARLTSGASTFTVLTRAQVEKRRAMSESWSNTNARPYSPWTKWEEEQWCKTAIRHLLTHGQVQLSPEMARAATSDERPLQLDDDGCIDALTLDEPAAELEQTVPTPASEPETEPPADEPPPVPAETAKASPADIRRISTLAGEAFPLPDAARGTKTKLQRQLRHALAFAATGARWHNGDLLISDVTPVCSRLEQIIAGSMTFAFDDDAVTFDYGTGDVTVEWAQIAEPES